MNMISKFIRQWKAFRLSLRLLKLIDPKKLEDLNVILEEIYPGIRAEIQALVESSDIHAMSKTLHYINTHGGVQKMADYYNNADKNTLLDMRLYIVPCKYLMCNTPKD